MNFSTIFLCKPLEGSIEFSVSQCLMQSEGGGGVLPVMACEVPFRLLIHERGAISLFGVYMGVTKSPGGFSGFQVTGMIEGFLGV